MGIRGASSLLSTDRRRFGRPWVLSNALGTGRPTGGDVRGCNLPSTTTTAEAEDAEESCPVAVVYIDGPALLYHLISHASDALVASTTSSPTSGPPAASRRLPPCRDLAYSSSVNPAFGVLPPTTVFLLARSFVTALLDAGADEVHLVVEGLADESKEAEQVNRMSDRAALCDVAAREILSCGGGGGTGRQIWRKVPHPFAERAMVEGVESLIGDRDASNDNGDGDCGDCSNSCSCDSDGGIASGFPCRSLRRGRVFVHRATGEAEEEICALIAERRENEAEEEEPRGSTVVLSNDTDFLVHDCSPGYVPLDSIEFFTSSISEEEEDDSSTFEGNCVCVGVRGWFYDSSRFASCLNLRREHLPVVSALAGCDRVPPTPQLRRRLEAARRNVLQDEKSGLRKRDRNNPSAKSCLVACARFVSRHGRSRGGGGGVCESPVVAGEHVGTDEAGWLRRVAWATCGKVDVGREDRRDELLSAILYDTWPPPTGTVRATDVTAGVPAPLRPKDKAAGEESRG